jgi:hypothetical protein
VSAGLVVEGISRASAVRLSLNLCAFAALREFFFVFLFCVFCAFSWLFLASVGFSAFEDLVAKSKSGSVKTMITTARIKIG